jgi:hypothetical protein
MGSEQQLPWWYVNQNLDPWLACIVATFKSYTNKLQLKAQPPFISKILLLKNQQLRFLIKTLEP